MKQQLNRLSAFVLALIMVLCAGLTVYAHVVPELDRLGSITITTQKDGNPITGGTLTVYRVAEVVENNGDYVFKPVGEFAACGELFVTSASMAELALRLQEYIWQNGVAALSTQNIGDQGKATFGSLPLGLYLMVQHRPAPGYSAVSPFLVSMPYYENDQYLYDLTALPKTVIEPSSQPTSEPDTTQPDTTQPDTTQPDTTQPDTTQPDTTQPDTTQPDTTQPDTTQPDTTQPDTTQPDTRPEPTDPDPTRPTRPDPTDPEPTQPDPTGPEPTQPDPTGPTRSDEPPTGPQLEDLEDPDTPLDGRYPDPTDPDWDDLDDPEIPLDGREPDDPLVDIAEPGLPLTGQLWWPVPVLAVVGMAFFAAGWLLFSNKEKNHER